MIGDLSHFSMVGFPVDVGSEQGMLRDLEPLTRVCEARPLGQGYLLCTVRDPSGGEMLIGLKQDGASRTFETANPAFDGEGRAEVVVTAEVSDPEWKTFERSYQANFAVSETPLIFEISDPTDAGRMTPGAKVTVEIAAFSFDIKAFADPAAFHESQKGEDLKWADNFFVPIGMFQDKEGARPAPYGMLSGEVLKAEMRSNTAGKGRFWWALVRTYDGVTIDVVIDPRQLTTPLKPGNVVSGVFWLTARVVP